MVSLRIASEQAKERVMARNAREIIRVFAETAALAIEASAPAVCTGPFCGDGSCPHFRQRKLALASASLVRKLGGVRTGR